MNGRVWTKRELAILRRDYPHKETQAVARDLGRSVCSCYGQASGAGLRKSSSYLARKRSLERERLRLSGIPHRYPKGHIPANAGLRRPGWAVGRMRETQFKKGQMPFNWMPVGSYHINSDGYLQKKLTDTGYGPKDWEAVHRLIWIQAHGPIPRGHKVCFKARRKTTELDDITLDALEMISDADLMRRNSFHTNYPKEIGRLIQLRGAVQRQINRRERLAKQN